MFSISGSAIGTRSTPVIDIPGSNKEPAVQVIKLGEQRYDNNQEEDKIHLRPGDEYDDPLAIMW